MNENKEKISYTDGMDELCENLNKALSNLSNLTKELEAFIFSKKSEEN